MALEASGRIFPRVDDEFSATTATLNMFAPRTMARFAAALARQFRPFKVKQAMDASRENPSDVRVAIITSPIAYVRRARNFRRRDYCSSDGRTGDQENSENTACAEQKPGYPRSRATRVVRARLHGPEFRIPHLHFKSRSPVARNTLLLRLDDPIKTQPQAARVRVRERENIRAGNDRAQ
jgi:hypothetical protein